jgi:uncharacterized membrane protein YjfL (UPF0719 family)
MLFQTLTAHLTILLALIHMMLGNNNNYSVQTAGGGFLADFGNASLQSCISIMLGLPDMSAYGGIAFNPQLLLGLLYKAFSPAAMCPIVGSWTTQLAVGVMR